MGCAASVSAGLSAGPSARLQRQKADIACSFRRVVPSRTDDRDCMARDKQQSVPTSRQQRMVKLRDVHAKRRDVRATSEVTACASMKETAAPSAAGVLQELPGFENVVEIEASLLESWKSWSSPRLRDPEGRPVPSPPDRHLHNRHIARMDKLQKDVEEAHTAFEQVVALRRGDEAYVAAGNAGLLEPQVALEQAPINGLHLE
mmetsp:Transcript_72768/g.170657  ORF Transcript_72768/g.170657 Transcript_72768/m.170657 type:complete len:203 (+) Transcript_72768:30-638(+)